MINIVKRFYKNNPTEFWIIVLIMLVSAILRFYKIDQYMTFLGDEGRDALMIKRILTTGDIPLIGPPTSIGNMYLGPLYYYMMTIPMAIFWLNPVAAAGMVAVIGTLTVGLIYYLSRVWFGKLSAIVAAILYSLSPVTITYSRASWNPNPAPFFALLAIIGIYLSRKSRNFYWLILTGGSLAFLVQMHYLALILIPVIGVLWVYELITIRYKKAKSQNLFYGTVWAVVLFLLLMSPLAIFDLKHNFMNYRAVKTFFTDRQETVNLNILNTFGRTIPIYKDSLIGRYLTAENPIATPIVSLILLIPILWGSYFLIKKKLIKWEVDSLALWLGIGLLGLSLYKRAIFDHYLGFLNPVPYLLLAGLIFITPNRFKYILASLILITLGWLNIQKSPLNNPPNNQLNRTQDIAKFIIKKSDGKPFNFALLSKNNYDAAYQFYLDVYGHKPMVVPFDITDQLFVVCEDQICQPVGHPKQEISHFGWSQIESEQVVEGVKIYKLIHNPNQPKS